MRIAEGSRERIQKKAKARQAATVYDRLVECAKRLMSLIERSKDWRIRIWQSSPIRFRLFAINGKNNEGRRTRHGYK